MKARLSRLGVAVWGCAAAIVPFAAVAGADPPDPHQPEVTHNYCPGGQWSFGFELRVCDGEKYPDGSYWHQWVSTDENANVTGRHYDCVGDGGNNVFPAPPPPGGCAGAIPPV